MSTVIQIRNVPKEVHAQLRIRAIQAGMSLSQFLLQELEHLVERPTLAEVLARVAARGPVPTAETAAAAVRAERARR